MIHLAEAEARRVALAAQGFADPMPRGRVDVRTIARALARTGVLQIDSVNVLVRAQYLPVFSRIGAYPTSLLDDLAYRRRALFEYWGHEASLLPVQMHPLFRWRMESAMWKGVDARFAHWAARHNDLVDDVYAEIVDRGPLAASDLTARGERSGPWWGWSAGKQALEYLFYVGRITAAYRRNFERVYDLTERVIPAAVLSLPTPPREEAHRELVARAARALGVATATDLADYFRLKPYEARPAIDALVEEGRLEPARVQGWPKEAYIDPNARMPRRVERAALLAPFDPLVWERARTERMFGFRYRIEIYTPAHKRIYGYYVLPFLRNERLVARVDLKADRASSALLVRSAFPEDGLPASEIVPSLVGELRRMAEWLGLAQIVVDRRGSLAAPLRAALRA